MKTISCLFVFLCLVATSAMAQSQITNPPAAASLVWTLSASPSATNYNVYYGVASRTYTNEVSLGNTTNAVIIPLVRGVTYYFAVTATGLSGTNTLESSFSNEVSYTPTNAPLPVVLILKGGN